MEGYLVMNNEGDVQPSMMGRMAAWCIRRNRLVVLLWVLALGATIFLSQAFAGEYNMSFSTPGAESDRAQTLLQEHFPARSGDTVEIVFEASQGVMNPAVRADVEELLDSATEIGYVASVVSPYSEDGARQISPSGTIAFATLLLDGDAQGMPTEDAAKPIDLAQGASQSELRFELSGFAIQAAQECEFSSEVIGIGVAAVILLISFGSLLAMGLPILTAIFGLGISSALIALLANFVQTPDFAPAMAMMIGIWRGNRLCAVHNHAPPFSAR
jgi:RND superfamily putative drug exporter